MPQISLFYHNNYLFVADSETLANGWCSCHKCHWHLNTYWAWTAACFAHATSTETHTKEGLVQYCQVMQMIG